MVGCWCCCLACPLFHRITISFGWFFLQLSKKSPCDCTISRERQTAVDSRIVLTSRRRSCTSLFGFSFVAREFFWSSSIVSKESWLCMMWRCCAVYKTTFVWEMLGIAIQSGLCCPLSRDTSKRTIHLLLRAHYKKPCIKNEIINDLLVYYVMLMEVSRFTIEELSKRRKEPTAAVAQVVLRPTGQSPIAKDFE